MSVFCRLNGHVSISVSSIYRDDNCNYTWLPSLSLIILFATPDIQIAQLCATQSEHTLRILFMACGRNRLVLCAGRLVLEATARSIDPLGSQSSLSLDPI